MAERVQALEAQNMGDKEWFMRGEAKAGARLNLLSPALFLTSWKSEI